MCMYIYTKHSKSSINCLIKKCDGKVVYQLNITIKQSPYLNVSFPFDYMQYMFYYHILMKDNKMFNLP